MWVGDPWDQYTDHYEYTDERTVVVWRGGSACGRSYLSPIEEVVGLNDLGDHRDYYEVTEEGFRAILRECMRGSVLGSSARRDFVRPYLVPYKQKNRTQHKVGVPKGKLP